MTKCGRDPQRVLLVGDTHCNLNWVVGAVIPSAIAAGADRIVQLGDFGYWPHIEKGQRFIDGVAHHTKQAEIPWLWLDGNHENHDAIPRDHDHYGGHRQHGAWFRYLARGTRWEWHGLQFVALGGAHSIDRDQREEGWSWWPQETITDADVQRAINGPPADVLLSHDTVAGHYVPGENASWKVDNPETFANRERLSVVADSLNVRLNIHGHYHARYTCRWPEHPNTRRIEGLSCDHDYESMALLDLTDPELELKHVRPGARVA